MKSTTEIFHKDMGEETVKIKKLNVPQEFRKEGMLRKLIKFESGNRDVAMYEVIKENWKYGSGHRGYEVMIVRYTTKDTEFYGNVTPAGSPIFPSNEQFGQYGWHYSRFETADTKFKELLNTPLKDTFFKKKYIFI